MKKLPNKDQWKSLLKNKKFSITFRKVEGSMRTFTVTRDMVFVKNVDPSAVPDSNVSLNWEDRVRVFDVDASAWKSFYPDRVTNYKEVKDI